MRIIVAQYIWLDNKHQFRSKIKVFNHDDIRTIKNFPEWNFDGSSTGQSETKSSDLLLKPVSFCWNPFRKARGNLYYIVLCSVLNSDRTPYKTNTHHILEQNINSYNNDIWFGIEQEYMIFTSDDKLFSNDFTIDKTANRYYCGVGTNNIYGKDFVERHLELCLDAGLKICGINAEVTPSQWEFQIGPLPPMEIANQLWLARYILIVLAEDYAMKINFDPKPFPDLNGSGAHTNFSTKEMRQEGGLEKIYEAIEKLKINHEKDIQFYGSDNKKRLTGIHETSSYDKFTFGNSDRSSSVRIPLNVQLDKKGYFEDRRPAANMDPYLVVDTMLKTILS